MMNAQIQIAYWLLIWNSSNKGPRAAIMSIYMVPCENENL